MSDTTVDPSGGNDALKVCMVGDSNVGKTSIVNRYTEDHFDPTEEQTIGVNFVSKMELVQGEPRRVTIWDTAGQEQFRSLVDLYFRKARAVILVYDVSSRPSFMNLEAWLARSRSLEPNVKAFVVGNKIDLEIRVVSRKEAERFARDNACRYHECSALTGASVPELFQQVFEDIDLAESTGTTIVEPERRCC